MSKLDKKKISELIQLKFSLSRREAECAFHLILGQTSKEIAIHINISYRTVETYIHNAKYKLNAKNNIVLVRKLLIEIIKKFDYFESFEFEDVR